MHQILPIPKSHSTLTFVEIFDQFDQYLYELATSKPEASHFCGVGEMCPPTPQSKINQCTNVGYSRTKGPLICRLNNS